MDEQSRAQNSAEALWQGDAVSKAMGMKLERVSPGHAQMSMRVRPDMVNGVKTCHGGILFSLADSTFGFACNSRNRISVAQNCSIAFVALAHLHDELTATAIAKAEYGRKSIYDVEIRNQSSALIVCFRGHARQLDGQLFKES